MFSLRASNISMRAIVTTRNGDVGALKIEERPDPIPNKGQVLIRVKASGLNFADILARQGLYPDGPSKPCVMGYEVSGTVEEVGDGTDQTLIGNSVIAMTRFGGQAELVVASITQILEKPETLSFEEGAAILASVVAPITGLAEEFFEDHRARDAGDGDREDQQPEKLVPGMVGGRRMGHAKSSGPVIILAHRQSEWGII